MNNKSITDFIKPTIITAQQYGTKVSVELNHSDTDIDELMEAFYTLVVGLGYHESGWKQYIVDKADEYKEEAAEEAIYEPSPQLKRVAEEYVNMLREQEIDAALAEHNADEDADWDITLNDGLENDGWTPELEQQFWSEQPSEPFATPEELSRDGGFDGNPYKQDTGAVFFTVPVNFYTDDAGNRVYDYEGMADEFEEKLSALDTSAVVMVSVETKETPNENLVKAVKKYNKKRKAKSVKEHEAEFDLGGSE